MNVTQIAGGIVLVDITAELPTHATKRYQRRRYEIDTHFLHHSGRLGRRGFEAIRNMVLYCVNHRGWAGSPYTYAMNHEPLFWDDLLRDAPYGLGVWSDDAVWNLAEPDDLVYFRLQPDTLRTYHTGGLCNQRGVATVLMGNTSTNGMSDSQVEIMEAHVPYVAERHGITTADIAGHFEAKEYGAKKNKAACPGKGATEWLLDYRDRQEVV